MEHRCGSRHRIAGTVTLQAAGVGAYPARLVEASISGMFVETAVEAPFCCNSVIDIEMTLPGEAALRTYRWQAMVIRKSGTGLGLMFDRLRPPAITRLMESAAAGMPLPARTPAAVNVVALHAGADKPPPL
jgi:hypothetical protein